MRNRFLTLSTNVKVYYAPDSHIDDSEKSLILLLELLLVKYLNRKDAIFRSLSTQTVSI